MAAESSDSEVGFVFNPEDFNVRGPAAKEQLNSAPFIMDQGASGTCWAAALTVLLTAQVEAEVQQGRMPMKLGKEEVTETSILNALDRIEKERKLPGTHTVDGVKHELGAGLLDNFHQFNLRDPSKHPLKLWVEKEFIEPDLSSSNFEQVWEWVRQGSHCGREALISCWWPLSGGSGVRGTKAHAMCTLKAQSDPQGRQFILCQNSHGADHEPEVKVYERDFMHAYLIRLSEWKSENPDYKERGRVKLGKPKQLEECVEIETLHKRESQPYAHAFPPTAGFVLPGTTPGPAFPSPCSNQTLNEKLDPKVADVLRRLMMKPVAPQAAKAQAALPVMGQAELPQVSETCLVFSVSAGVWVASCVEAVDSGEVSIKYLYNNAIKKIPIAVLDTNLKRKGSACSVWSTSGEWKEATMLGVEPSTHQVWFQYAAGGMKQVPAQAVVKMCCFL